MSKEKIMQQFLTDQLKLQCVALRLLQNSWDVDDVMQNVFIKAWMNADQLRSETACSAWLMSICRNACMDWQRKQGRRREVELTELADSTELESLLDMLWLDSLMGRLCKDSSHAAQAFYLKGCSISEIAEAMGKSTGAVKGMLYRARKGMRAIAES